MSESALPYLPRRTSTRPQSLEELHVAKGVHALPESRVHVGRHLSFAGEPFEWPFFPNRHIAIDVLENLSREYEVAGIDPSAISTWLLFEMRNAGLIHRDPPEPAGGLSHRDRRQRSLLTMKADELPNIDIGYPVTVRQTEFVVVAEIRRGALDPASCHRLRTGVNQGDLPRF